VNIVEQYGIKKHHRQDMRIPKNPAGIHFLFDVSF
jgi:hypothetical protein